MGNQSLAFIGVKDVQRRAVLCDGEAGMNLHDHSVCAPVVAGCVGTTGSGSFVMR
jgi:hypothetical protein